MVIMFRMFWRLYRNLGACGGIFSRQLFPITGLVCSVLEGVLILLKLFLPSNR